MLLGGLLEEPFILFTLTASIIFTRCCEVLTEEGLNFIAHFVLGFLVFIITTNCLLALLMLLNEQSFHITLAQQLAMDIILRHRPLVEQFVLRFGETREVVDEVGRVLIKLCG